MPDIFVKIYLYFVIFASLLFFLMFGVLWFVQRRRPQHRLLTRKRLWRNLFFLVSGLVSWYLFSFRLVENWLVMLCAFVMLVISVYAAEAIGPKEH
jgi:hypothetical protein